MGRVARRGGAAGLTLVLAGSSGWAADAVRVRASIAVAPCAASAARAFESATGMRARVLEAGAQEEAADVLATSAVEMTRALEGGTAVIGTEVDVARIPWVLTLAGPNAGAVRILADLARTGGDVWVLGGPSAYEARRALAELPPERVRETSDVVRLREVAAAVVPLSLAGRGERVSLDVPPLVARAAVLAGTPHPEQARALVKFLGSEAGQEAFGRCANP